jgi:hypothetical protein
VQLANHSSAAVIIAPQGKTYQKAYLNRCIPFLLVVVLFYACQSAPTFQQNSVKPPTPIKDIWVPKWYASLPQLPGCELAYAHSGIYINSGSQKQAILDNGAANWAKSKHVALEVGWAASQKSSHSQTAAYIKEEGWKDLAKNIKEDLEILSQYRLDHSILALVGKCSENLDNEILAAMIDNTLVKVSSEQPPIWVSDPLQNSGQLFGVGTAAGHTTAAKAWQEAERQARADLALRLAAQHKILEKNLVQNTYAKAHFISETRAKLTLYNVKIVRHAYSQFGQTFYALVSIPTAVP